jgi:hypothetical protein
MFWVFKAIERPIKITVKLIPCIITDLYFSGNPPLNRFPSKAPTIIAPALTIVPSKIVPLYM